MEGAKLAVPPMLGKMGARISLIYSILRVYRNPVWRFLDRFGLLPRAWSLDVALRNGIRLRIRPRTSDFGVLDDIFVRGVYDRALSTLSAGSTVVDVGAQCGAFAVAAAKRGAVVCCVEPIIENVRALESNAFLNDVGDRIRVVHAAIASEKGPRSMFVMAGDTGGSTLYPSVHPEWSSAPGVSSVTVNCVTLKDVLEHFRLARCTCLKMDCEGSEYEVFGGSADEDLSRIGAFILEYHPNGDVRDIARRLQGLGYGVDVAQHPSVLYALKSV